MQNSLRWSGDKHYDFASEGTADFVLVMMLAQNGTRKRAETIASKLLDSAAKYGVETKKARMPFGLRRIPTNGKPLDEPYAIGFATACDLYARVGLETMLAYPFRAQEDVKSYLRRIERRLPLR